MVPYNRVWSRTILWGNHKLKKGVIKPQGSAYSVNTTWGTALTAEGDNIVWGTNCKTPLCDGVIWGAAAMEADNIVWGTFAKEGDNIVWGTALEGDNIVWGTALEADNIVWGTACGGADCADIVWGASLGSEFDNIVWSTASDEDSPLFDDPTVPSVFDGTNFDSLFGDAGGALPPVSLPSDPPLGTLPDPPAVTLVDPTLVGGGF